MVERACLKRLHHLCTGVVRDRPLSRAVLWLTCGLALGLVAGLLLTRWSLGERLVIGGTSQELSVLLEIDGRRIVIGGGGSRSDLTDFLDRSTLPWDRQVDLLLVPAWDERHLPGALDLIERRPVRGIVLLGLPGSAPAWTLFERAAQARQITVRYIDVPQRVTLADRFWLELYPAADGSRVGGTRVLVHLGDVRVTVVDAPKDGRDQWAAAADAHLLVAMRQPPAGLGPMPLVARPLPRRPSDFVPIDAAYELVLDRGRRATLRFTGHELRVPLADIAHREKAPSSTP